MAGSLAESNNEPMAHMSRYTNEDGVAKHERIVALQAVGLTFCFYAVFYPNSVNILRKFAV